MADDSLLKARLDELSNKVSELESLFHNMSLSIEQFVNNGNGPEQDARRKDDNASNPASGNVAEVDELKRKLTELEEVVNEQKTAIKKLNQSAEYASGAQPSGKRQAKVFDLSALRPFDIQYDPVTKEWLIYLPEGCVMVGNFPAYYEDGTDSNDMAVISPAETLWAHVHQQGSDYSFSINDEPPDYDDTSRICDFKVASFDSSREEVVAQYVSNVVIDKGIWYVCGNDSNITFRMCEDSDDNDRYRKTMIDVYYL